MINQNEIKNLEEIIKLENTPLEQHISFHSTYEILENAAKQFPTNIAITFLPEGKPDKHAPNLTYQQLLSNVIKTVNLFGTLGITTNKVVSIVLPNLPETYSIMWAAETAGIANPIAPMLPPEIMAHLLEIAETELLVTMQPRNPFWENIVKAREIYQNNTGRKLKLLVIGAETSEKNNIYNFNELLKDQPAEKIVSKREIKADTVCAYFHSSGTTGMPKLVRLTQGGKLYSAWAVAKCFGYEEKDVVLAGLPLFHVGAPTVTGNAAFMVGAQVILLSPMGWMDENVVNYFWETMAEYKGTITASMSWWYAAVANVPTEKSTSTFRLAISGNAFIPEQLKKFEDKVGKQIVSEIYGLTEITSLATFNPLATRKAGSMGVRLPYSALKVVEINNNEKECKPGEAGILVIKGPHVADYKQKEFNNSALTSDGWLISNDIVTKDKEDYFHIICRKSEAIFCNNQMISSLELEHILLNHSDVANTAVIAKSDLSSGQVPVALVELKPDAKTDANDLLIWFKQQEKNSDHWPAEIRIVKKLPLNAMGKVQKNILEAEFKLSTPKKLEDDVCSLVLK